MENINIKLIEDNNVKTRIMENLDHVFPTKHFDRDDFSETLDKIMEHAVFFAAYSGDCDNSVGYIAFYANDTVKKTAFISMLGVETYMQGKHIGTMLVDTAAEYAKNHSMCTIRLEVLKSNVNAIGFYYHYGFEKEEDKSDNSMFMTKMI